MPPVCFSSKKEAIEAPLREEGGAKRRGEIAKMQFLEVALRTSYMIVDFNKKDKGKTVDIL